MAGEEAVSWTDPTPSTRLVPELQGRLDATLRGQICDAPFCGGRETKGLCLMLVQALASPGASYRQQGGPRGG